MAVVTITGTMSSSKELTLEASGKISQGEAGSAALTVNIPLSMTGYLYFYEFECPHGVKLTSDAVPPVDLAEITYILPSSVLRYAGRVYVQLVARSEDGLLIFKSERSASAAFEVEESIAVDISLADDNPDFITLARQSIKDAETATVAANTAAAAALSGAESAAAAASALSAAVAEGRLDAKSAYTLAAEAGYSGTEAAFYGALAAVGAKLEDAPSDGVRYGRKNGNWSAIDNVLPEIESVTDKGKSVRAVAGGGSLPVYALMQSAGGIKYYSTASSPCPADDLSVKDYMESAGAMYVETEYVYLADESCSLSKSHYILRYTTDAYGDTVQYISDTQRGITYKRVYQSGSWTCPELLLDRKARVELALKPSDFTQTVSGWKREVSLQYKLTEAYVNLSNLTGTLAVAEDSRSAAEDAGLSSEADLVDGVLTVTAANKPQVAIQVSLLLI